ncbi:MAG: DUF3570 domain-containing protein [Bacteroidia bacterium]|nr:DUF3570 domain-containing protein [Bacteroidia bacterium]
MKIIWIILFMGIPLGMWGQVIPDSPAVSVFLNPQTVDVDFIFNYYEQEGNHSPVTGGQGTEELEDISGKVVIQVPLDTLTRLNTAFTINHYTSASTDKIDTYVSSASRRDSRALLVMGFDRDRPVFRQSWGISGGGSIESDYISAFLTARWSQKDKAGNRELAFQGQAYFDRWVVIFPEELRAPGLASVPTDKRRSFNLAASWSQVINPRLQAYFSGEIVLQAGLLSTPFHRVYFQGETLPMIEKLPLIRVKYPLGFRLNYYASDFLIMRFYYRFYFDSFSILAHTTSLEIPVKIGPFFSVYPFYRFHIQSSARYFNEYGQHTVEEEYYTSDFDLSAFHSHKYGLGLSFSPVYGILRFQQKNGRTGQLKNIDLRYARYERSDGLTAFMVGADLGFNF